MKYTVPVPVNDPPPVWLPKNTVLALAPVKIVVPLWTMSSKNVVTEPAPLVTSASRS